MIFQVIGFMIHKIYDFPILSISYRKKDNKGNVKLIKFNYKHVYQRISIRRGEIWRDLV